MTTENTAFPKIAPIVIFVFVLDCISDSKSSRLPLLSSRRPRRAPLLAPFRAHQGPRHRPPPLLDPRLYLRKLGLLQPRQERMVVPAENVSTEPPKTHLTLPSRRTGDQIEMALFVLRYLSCLLMFLLGLKAPGITQNINYFTLNDSTRNLPPQVSLIAIRCVTVSEINPLQTTKNVKSQRK